MEALEWVFLRREHPRQDLKRVREHASEGKAFQEGTASTKALREECWAPAQPTGQRAAQSEQGEAEGGGEGWPDDAPADRQEGFVSASEKREPRRVWSTGGTRRDIQCSCLRPGCLWGPKRVGGREDGLGGWEQEAGRLQAPHLSSDGSSSGLSGPPLPLCTPDQAAFAQKALPAPPGKGPG